MSGYTMTQAELLYSLAAPVTKNAYTTQAVITAPATAARAIVPAGFFGGNPNGIGRKLKLEAAGTIANTSAATFQMVLGFDVTPGTLGGSLATPWPTLAPTASTTCTWELIAQMWATQVGNGNTTIQTNGKLVMSVVASGTLSTAPQVVMFSTATASLNNEAQAAIELWGTWSANSASNTTTVQQFDLFGLN